MNDNQKYKKKVRNSKKWLSLRHYKNVEQKGLDVISCKKLVRGCCLHHKDLRIENYDKLDNADNFVLLNKKTHEMVHFIYNLYVKDRKVIDRLVELLDKMVSINNVDDTK